MDDTYDEREEELSSLAAIFPELRIHDNYSASIDLPVTPDFPDGRGLLVGFRKQVKSPHDEKRLFLDIDGRPELYHGFKYLPDLKLYITLPDGYPAETPPTATLQTDPDWAPRFVLDELEQRAVQLWEEYGQCQILYTYIDSLITSANDGFHLNDDGEAWELKPSYKTSLVDFNNAKAKSVFEAGTYNCGICLEPKKGSLCYFNADCEHVFCKPCLQDYYTSAITEGNVDIVRCADTTCGEEQEGNRLRKKQRSLHPRKLLEMGIPEETARRYVELKRQKRLDVDKNTVYCPRKACKHAARNDKYPPIPANLDDYRSEDEEEAIRLLTQSLLPKKAHRDTDVDERLAVCENPKCKMAFCRICYKSWHGSFERCRPRDADELSAEEKASYDYIAQNTSPCAYCKAPVQKTYGCNHMHCYQCKTHFCYLCSSYLPEDNPYQHYNKEGEPCYRRLFDLVEGDNGQEGGGAFVGARHWEQMAVEAALEAEEAEEARRMAELVL